MLHCMGLLMGVTDISENGDKHDIRKNMQEL